MARRAATPKPPSPPDPPDPADMDASLSAAADRERKLSFTPVTVFQARLGVEATGTEDETLVGDLLAHRYFRTNETGAFLWRQASSGATFASISAALEEVYGLGPEQARDEAEQFLATLVQAGLLTHSTPD